MGYVHIMALRRIDGTLERMQETSLPPKTCEAARSEDGGHWSCFAQTYTFLGKWDRWGDRAVDLRPDERAAAGDLAAKGVTTPADFVGARFWRSEAWGALLIEYQFNPESEGISSNAALSLEDADWNPSHIHAYPEKVAYAAKIKAWGLALWPKVKASFAAAAPKNTGVDETTATAAGR